MASFLRQWAKSRRSTNIQFPPEIVCKVTLYPHFWDSSTGNQIAAKCVLNGCFWNDDSISMFSKTGVQTRYAVTLFIPYRKEVTGAQYLTTEEWNNLSPYEALSGKYWTINTKQLPLMVRGECVYEFHWGCPTSATDSVTRQELNLMNTNTSVFRVVDINEQFLGTVGMHHIVIRA